MFYIKLGNRTESEKKFEDWYIFVYINLYSVVNFFQHIDGAVLKSRKRKMPTFQEMQKKDLKCFIAYFDCKLNGF